MLQGRKLLTGGEDVNFAAGRRIINCCEMGYLKAWNVSGKKKDGRI